MFTLTVIDSDMWIANGIIHYFNERNIEIKVIGEEEFEHSIIFAAESDVIISELCAFNRDVQTFIELFISLRRASPKSRLIFFTDINEKALINYLAWLLPDVIVLHKSCNLPRLAAEVFEKDPGRSKADIRPKSEFGFNTLTTREFGLLRFLASCNSLTDVGLKLKLSVKTISHHKRNIMRKLNCQNEKDLSKILSRLGFCKKTSSFRQIK